MKTAKELLKEIKYELDEAIAETEQVVAGVRSHLAKLEVEVEAMKYKSKEIASAIEVSKYVN